MANGVHLSNLDKFSPKQFKKTIDYLNRYAHLQQLLEKCKQESPIVINILYEKIEQYDRDHPESSRRAEKIIKKFLLRVEGEKLGLNKAELTALVENSDAAPLNKTVQFLTHLKMHQLSFAPYLHLGFSLEELVGHYFKLIEGIHMPSRQKMVMSALAASFAQIEKKEDKELILQMAGKWPSIQRPLFFEFLCGIQDPFILSLVKSYIDIGSPKLPQLQIMLSEFNEKPQEERPLYAELFMLATLLEGEERFKKEFEERVIALFPRMEEYLPILVNNGSLSSLLQHLVEMHPSRMRLPIERCFRLSENLDMKDKILPFLPAEKIKEYIAAHPIDHGEEINLNASTFLSLAIRAMNKPEEVLPHILNMNTFQFAVVAPFIGEQIQIDTLFSPDEKKNIKVPYSTLLYLCKSDRLTSERKAELMRNVYHTNRYYTTEYLQRLNRFYEQLYPFTLQERQRGLLLRERIHEKITLLEEACLPGDAALTALITEGKKERESLLERIRQKNYPEKLS